MSSAIARPEHPALITDDDSWSYQQLQQAVAQRAGALQARGVKPGMTVALLGPPTSEWVIYWHAIAWLGASAAPLAHAAPPEERDRLLRAIAPQLVLETGQALAEAPPPDERFWPLDEVRALVCTSGTTGGAKLVPLSTQQLLLSAMGSTIRLGHHLDDRWLCCLPLHHVGGLSILTRVALLGTTVLLPQQFDPQRVARSLDEGDATMVSLVPTMLERVLDARPEQPFPPSLRVILLGGAPASEALLERCRAIGAPVALSWGMTEAASQLATHFAGDLPPNPGAGPPLSFARIDDNNGTLAVRGPLVGGQLQTNDTGWIDAQHRVHLSGRADDIIVSGGEKIAPSEVESVLRSHPAIDDAVVVATNSKRWGQRPVVLLQGKDNKSPSDQALHDWCRSRLASFKIPDTFAWCNDIPRNELGKVSRRGVLRLLTQLDLISEQAEGAQAVEQDRRNRNRFEPIEVDKGMDESRSSAHLPVRAAQAEREGNRLFTQPLDSESHVDPLLHADRPLEVRLSVDERHAELLGDKHPLDVAVDSHEHLFVGGVAELEHPSEEHNPGAIHFKETSRNLMNEGHDDDAR